MSKSTATTANMSGTFDYPTEAALNEEVEKMKERSGEQEKKEKEFSKNNELYCLSRNGPMRIQPSAKKNRGGLKAGKTFGVKTAVASGRKIIPKKVIPKKKGWQPLLLKQNTHYRFDDEDFPTLPNSNAVATGSIGEEEGGNKEESSPSSSSPAAENFSTASSKASKEVVESPKKNATVPSPASSAATKSNGSVSTASSKVSNNFVKKHKKRKSPSPDSSSDYSPETESSEKKKKKKKKKSKKSKKKSKESRFSGTVAAENKSGESISEFSQEVFPKKGKPINRQLFSDFTQDTDGNTLEVFDQGATPMKQTRQSTETGGNQLQQTQSTEVLDGINENATSFFAADGAILPTHVQISNNNNSAPFSPLTGGGLTQSNVENDLGESPTVVGTQAGASVGTDESEGGASTMDIEESRRKCEIILKLLDDATQAAQTKENLCDAFDVLLQCNKTVHSHVQKLYDFFKEDIDMDVFLKEKIAQWIHTNEKEDESTSSVLDIHRTHALVINHLIQQLRKKRMELPHPQSPEVQQVHKMPGTPRQNHSADEEDPEAALKEAEKEVQMSQGSDVDSSGNLLFFSSCNKDPNQEPIDGVPDGTLQGCSNVYDFDGKLAKAESFLANVCPTHPHLPKKGDNVLKFHPDFIDYGKKSENAAIQLMNKLKLVENSKDEELKDLKLTHAYKVGWDNNFRHFPDAKDKFGIGSQVACTHKTWQRKYPPPKGSKKKQYSQTRYDEPDSFTEYEEISRETTKEGIKKYQRLTRKFYQFIEMEDGTYQVKGVVEFQIRVHLWQKYLMAERAIKLDVVPPGYMLDPIERAWYLILRHGNLRKHMKGRKNWKGVRIQGATGYLTLECSHLDHSYFGLDYLRIETKGENLCRVVNCFDNIRCINHEKKNCKYVINGTCPHQPTCKRTFTVICPNCAP